MHEHGERAAFLAPAPRSQLQSFSLLCLVPLHALPDPLLAAIIRSQVLLEELHPHDVEARSHELVGVDPHVRVDAKVQVGLLGIYPLLSQRIMPMNAPFNARSILPAFLAESTWIKLCGASMRTPRGKMHRTRIKFQKGAKHPSMSAASRKSSRGSATA